MLEQDQKEDLRASAKTYEEVKEEIDEKQCSALTRILQGLDHKWIGDGSTFRMQINCIRKDLNEHDDRLVGQNDTKLANVYETDALANI